MVTDLTPKEIVFGKLGGVLYNTKEMVLLPLALCGCLWFWRAISLENLLYLLVALGVLYLFVAVLGLHAGINYVNSRTAIATSLGTVFFLFVGVALCMRMMEAFSGSFQAQLQPFLAFMIGGGVGLYVALGAQEPIDGDRRGVVPLPLRHLLRDHQFPHGLHARRVSGDGRGLRLHDGGHARCRRFTSSTLPPAGRRSEGKGSRRKDECLVFILPPSAFILSFPLLDSPAGIPYLSS